MLAIYERPGPWPRETTRARKRDLLMTDITYIHCRSDSSKKPMSATTRRATCLLPQQDVAPPPPLCRLLVAMLSVATTPYCFKIFCDFLMPALNSF